MTFRCQRAESSTLWLAERLHRWTHVPWRGPGLSHAHAEGQAAPVSDHLSPRSPHSARPAALSPKPINNPSPLPSLGAWPRLVLSLLRLTVLQISCLFRKYQRLKAEGDDAHRQWNLSNPSHTEVCYSRIPEPLVGNNFFFLPREKNFFELSSNRGARMGVTAWATLWPQRKVWGVPEEALGSLAVSTMECELHRRGLKQLHPCCVLTRVWHVVVSAYRAARKEGEAGRPDPQCDCIWRWGLEGGHKAGTLIR